MKVQVTKLTGIEELHAANASTTGNESHMTLARAYALGHSPIRTQQFKVVLEDIPLFVASQLVRQTQGVQWFQRSKRPDRGGKDFREECEGICDDCEESLNLNSHDSAEMFITIRDRVWSLTENFDRYARTTLTGYLNAEALMNMAHKRLCAKASKETRDVVAMIRDKVSEVDPDLAKHMVPQCIYRGGICPEYSSCGLHKNEKVLNEYKALYGQ